MFRTARIASIAAVCTLFIGLLTAAPANASSTHRFDFVPEDGLSSGYGTITFYERSVNIRGSVKSHNTGCARASFNVYTHPPNEYDHKGERFARETRDACGRGPGSSTDFNFTVEIGRGGAVYVEAGVDSWMGQHDGRRIWNPVYGDCQGGPAVC
ncbi:hypothetical protein ACSDR0_50000 [Streptosporangium sp. G11]|uniref:hypothetical protein n=1 Tax=Streptosporangium sp. G11 TaxID=3436926 RepID=UPI003EBF7984